MERSDGIDAVAGSAGVDRDPPVVKQQSGVNQAKHRWFWPRIAVFSAVVLVCLLGDIFLPSLFWNRRFFGDWKEQTAFAAVGGLVSQLALLAVWCAIGPQAHIWRLLVTTSLSILVCSAYIVGLQLPDYPGSGLPNFVGVFILAVGVGGFFVSALLVWFLSWLTGERIKDAQGNSDVAAREQNYSIGYLIGLTTAVAFIVAMLRAVMPQTGELGPPRRELVTVSLMAFQHAVFTILLLFAALTLVLRNRKNWLGAVWLGLLLAFALPANLLLMSQYRTVRLTDEVISNLIFYTVGFLGAVLIQLLLARLVGYRLNEVSA